ncbi:MAG: mucoidy inhibitor MuiA family protein [Sedimentisphaerales bacterium]|nr:mucoidy inhibitor MuiA family protein [Sedimentisphaerales bacterium]
MIKTMIQTGGIAVLLACGWAAAQAGAIDGQITDVIVYRGQALVTRSIPVDLPAGDGELVVGHLPEQIVPESLYAQTGGDVTVLSVRYRTRAVRQDTREEVKRLDEQIEEINEKLRRSKRNLEHCIALAQEYDAQWKLAAEGASLDLKRSILQSEPLERLTGYLEAKSAELHEKNVSLEYDIAQRQKELDLLQRKRQEYAADHARTEREAVVFLNKKENAATKIELSYVVNGASWSPQYNLRAQPDDSQVLVEYLAVVHQASGEDWSNTALALSTAEPSLVASPPALEPMEIALSSSPVQGQVLSLINTQLAQQQQPAQSDIQYIDQSKQFEDLLRSRRANFGKGKLAQDELNRIAVSNQMWEFNADREALKQMRQQVAVIKRTEGVSAMYRLAGALTLPSRSDQQLVTISTTRLPADFTLIATPLLTDYVYLQGAMVNNSQTIFLPGPAGVYRNGEFVGKGDMQLVTIGQSFTSGFGIDSQVQVVREFKDKKVETLWGNRVDEQTYHIEISNFKDREISLRLLDRIPYAENPNVEVSLLEPSHPLSTDAEYLRNQRSKGILRWDMTLEPNTTGEKAAVVTYGFTLKYDKNMSIHTVSHQ